MVQGHATPSHFAQNSSAGFAQYTYIELLSELATNMGRELTEEVKLKNATPAEQTKFAEALNYIPHSNGVNISVVKYDNEGTIRRHLCIYFDIDLEKYKDMELYDHFISHNIISAEPTKHKVRFVTYEDLLHLPSMDYLCDWVKGALLYSPWFAKYCDWVVDTKYDWTKEV